MEILQLRKSKQAGRRKKRERQKESASTVNADVELVDDVVVL